MDKLSTETSSSSAVSTAGPTEKRALSEVMHNTKRTGGNYGSLAKSQLQPTFYVVHNVESDDTMQRLALKYSINVQEIKRVNKLWSDGELSLRETIHIPVNSSQLTALRTVYPNLDVVQSLSTPTKQQRNSLDRSMNSDEASASFRSSDSSTSIPSTTTSATFQDYFSKIDQQISLSKKSLQSLDIKSKYPSSQANDISQSYFASNGNIGDNSTSQNNRTKTLSSGRNNGNHTLSENSVFVSVTTQNSRDRHVSAALERIQREKDDFDEL